MHNSSKWTKGEEVPLYMDWDYLGHLHPWDVYVPGHIPGLRPNASMS